MDKFFWQPGDVEWSEADEGDAKPEGEPSEETDETPASRRSSAQDREAGLVQPPPGS
jgi:hypothetical protein